MTTHTRTFIRLLLLSLLALPLAAFAIACGDNDGGGSASPTSAAQSGTPARNASFPLTLKRSDGKDLTLAKAAARIVSLSPGATESLYAIGAESALVAVDKQADYPEPAASFATKVDAYQPNIETIAGLNPDLVIVADDTNGVVAALDRLSIPVLYNDLDDDLATIDDVIAYIRTLGDVTGRGERADEVASALAARVDDVRADVDAIESGEAPSVYHELDDTFFSAAEQTFIGNVYKTLGAKNIAGDGGGNAYPQLTQEAIIAADPDVIILADEEFGTTVESVKARPGWDAMTAVRENRIFGIDPDIISRPGPRIVDALEQVFQRLYPPTS